VHSFSVGAIINPTNLVVKNNTNVSYNSVGYKYKGLNSLKSMYGQISAPF
jgi:hypothetical protein